MIDFSNVNIGFTAADVLSGGVNFYLLFVGFIVMILAIKFAPQIVYFLFGIIGTARNGRDVGSGFWESSKRRAKSSRELYR